VCSSDLDAFWAKIFTFFGEEARRSLHRWTALVFTLLGVYHLIYLAARRRGRFVAMAMIPRWNDAVALTQRMLYNVGLRRTPPAHHGYYSYAEKIEYLALLWGSLVMVATGALLVFNNFTLKHFPLWMSDLVTLVHYYEAVLACLAILIWHGYGVLFDPAVYPMNWAWLTGRLKRGRKPPPDDASGQI
jgi:hypothetical protein